jgi:hypothetical protein
MKIYTKRKGRCRRQQRQTRNKYSRRRLRYGGVSRGPRAHPSRTTPSSATPSKATPSRASTRSASAKHIPGLVVFRNSVPVSQSRGRTPSRAPSRAPPKTSLRNAGISKKKIKDDAEALQAARIISNFPNDMDKFLKMVINNYELLNYEGVKLALREQISINQDPVVGRLSTNGIIFISYICGKLVCLLNELSTLPKSDVGKKRSLLYRIKQIEKVICLLDDVGCSWGVRPYNEAEMDAIAEYYTTIKKPKGLTEYHQQLNTFIDKYFPVLKKYIDPSHVVSSSMCRRLIPGHVLRALPTIEEELEEVD